MPPKDSNDYACDPPLMPPEVFIHYLEHGEGDLNPCHNEWLGPLPKRLHDRVIDSTSPCFGYGIHIIEGPNREGIFWITICITTVVLLASVVWAILMKDVQGGFGLGAMMIASYMALLSSFLYRLGGT